MTYRVRERLRRYVAGAFDRPQKTKTLAVVAAGGIAPAAVGDTRAPRKAEPATTPDDTIGA